MGAAQASRAGEGVGGFDKHLPSRKGVDMSIKVMSAIFETELPDLKDAEGHVTKASTIKLVLLALADHADDQGEGAYPGLTRMELKTGFSRQGIINVYDALIHNGILRQDGISRLGTNKYAILVDKMRALSGSPPISPVNPVASGCQPDLPPVNPVASGCQPDLPVVKPVAEVVNHIAQAVNPVDLNRPLTILKPSKEEDEEERTQLLRDLYFQNFGIVPPALLEVFKRAATTYPNKDWYPPAFEVAVKNGARSWQYVETVLKGWLDHGFGWKPVTQKPAYNTSRAATRANDAFTALQNYIQEEQNGRPDRDRNITFPFFDND